METNYNKISFFLTEIKDMFGREFASDDERSWRLINMLSNQIKVGTKKRVFYTNILVRNAVIIESSNDYLAITVKQVFCNNKKFKYKFEISISYSNSKLKRGDYALIYLK